jgi:uncharacterized protein (DUF2062 family)
MEKTAMKSIETAKRKLAAWLRQGISPRRLALTLALGFAIGCFPVLGIPTALCALLAVALGLNLPAIQAANYAAMPLQLVLIMPFVRLGQLLGFGPGRTIQVGALPHGSPSALLMRTGSLAGEAMLAWLLVAIPAVTLMTVILTVLLRHIPVVASAGQVD